MGMGVGVGMNTCKRHETKNEQDAQYKCNAT